MKILVVTNLYPPHALGGYELSCQDVVRRWRERGHDVCVLTTRTRLAGVADDPGEVGIHRDLAWYWEDHDLRRPRPRERLRIERSNRSRLGDLLQTLSPDVVSLWAMGGMSMSLVSLCVQRSAPLVAVVEDEWLSYGPHVDAWSAAWSRRPAWLARIAATVTRVPTRPPALPPNAIVAFASDYLRRRGEVTANVGFVAAEVVPLGIDPVDFPPRAVQRRPWRGRMLCVGRIEERKGFDVAVRALAELPDATLRLVGPGNGHLGDLIALARDLGVADRITTDVIARSDLAGVYASADVLLFPSRWDEPFGLVPLEAMSQATPVVATRRGGSAEFLVDGVNCLAIDIDDAVGLADAVKRLAADDELRDRLTRDGLHTAKRYDVRRFADAEALHERAIGQPPC